MPASFVTVEHGSLVLDTLKKAEDGNGYILRLYESAGRGGKATLRFAKEIKALSICDMMEQDQQEASFAGNAFSFETTPYCIHTYRINF